MSRFFCFLLIFVLVIGVTPHNVSAQSTSSELSVAERQAMLQQIVKLLEVVRQLQVQLEAKRALEKNSSVKLQVDSTKEKILLQEKSGEHIRGNPNADTKIVVYSDFDCPFCNRFHRTILELPQEMFSTGKLAWVQRHYPIEQLHPRAKEAALASECISKYEGEGAFWEFADSYYEARSESNNVNDSLLDKVLDQTGFDSSEVKKCIKDKESMGIINESLIDASDLGIYGTPTSYVVNKNGKIAEIPGAMPLATLTKVINEVLNSSAKTSVTKTREFLPTADPVFFGKISVKQVAPSTIKIIGELTPPTSCTNAPDHEFVLALGNGETKKIKLDDCKSKDIEETVVLTPSQAPQFVDLTLRQVDVPNNVWMNYNQANIIIKSTNPFSLEITDLTGQGEKG